MDDIRPRLEKALSGTYTLERELGGGGMSRTYLMREVALQRQVVVKVLAPELLAGISVERFRREVLLAAQLQHPHVVPVLTAGDMDGIPWFSMPYVDGDSLRDRLAKGGVGIGEAVSILRDVARALGYAHARGIVHRDIKPDNVLLSGGSATVTDFGIAKAISAARTDGGVTSSSLTQVGTSIGTPAYMAPEQAAGDPDTDHRADIYSFGVMAYEVLAGRPPFIATTPTKLLAAHMAESPRDLLEFRPDCPPSLAALVMRCLAKDPDQRPAAAGEMVQVLENVTTSGSGAMVPEILRGGRIRMGRAIAMWAAATIAVIVTAWAAREVIGLPDWVLTGAIVIMAAGLPVLLLTAYVQRMTLRAFTATPSRTPVPQGTMATLAMKASPHLSWRRTWLGGAIAVGVFALLVVGFMVMRAAGIGPMASLRGDGTFGATEMIMVADFSSPASDSTLGATLAEALRTDLDQSASLNVISRRSILEVLELMQRPAGGGVTFELAREIATREGAKAVLDGDIVKLGQSYVVSARLITTLDGKELASFRETADSENDLIAAIGRLSRDVRTKAGESLKAIRSSDELDRVTTHSLPALRKYVEGMRLADDVGDVERGIELLREAVALDTAFAMGWRKLAIVLGNNGLDPEGQIVAVATAYRHRDRLSEMERLLTEALYFNRGPNPDALKAIAAYEAASRLDTTSIASINNAAVLLGDIRQYERAESLYRRAIRLPQTFPGAFVNLVITQINNGRISALDSTVALLREQFPESNDLWEAESFAAWGKGDLDKTDSILRAAIADPKTSRQKIQSGAKLSMLRQLQGRLGEARRIQEVNSNDIYQREKSAVNQLSFALDTAYFEAISGRRDAAVATWKRAITRNPIADIPPISRPWSWLRNFALTALDPTLARQAAEGWERDQASMTPNRAGHKLIFDGAIAYTEGRWAEAIAKFREADRSFALNPQPSAALEGLAWRQLGQADSAIVAFERFLNTPDPDIWYDGHFKADVLQHLGELYEAKGNRAKAIEYYSQFTEQWTNADPELQVRVREVRERIARLKGEIG
jgi:tetratricopeptide (TPR) repeat protein/tRNA A-37 threonylcarbamoyl transferase component Bud32